jgi:hypothetical protein
MVNDHLNIVMEDGKVNPDVWALGDAALIEETRLPATAQGHLHVSFSAFDWFLSFYSCQPTSQVSCQKDEPTCAGQRT